MTTYNAFIFTFLIIYYAQTVVGNVVEFDLCYVECAWQPGLYFVC